jgi:hypothetical protein
VWAIRLPNIVSGAFTSVLAKHTKNLSLVDILAVGVDRMQRSFELIVQADEICMASEEA